MSTFLYRLGRGCYGKPWPFIVGWLLVLAGVVAALVINGVKVTSEMKIDNTEAQQVLDRVAEELPEASGGQASVVFTVADGERLDTPERMAAIAQTVQKVYALQQVVNPADLTQGQGQAAGGPWADQPGSEPSEPGTAAPPYRPLVVDGSPVPGVLVSTTAPVALFQFQFTVPSTSLTDEQVSSVLEVVEDAGQGTGLRVLPSDSLKAIEIPVGVAEVVGLAVAAVVLVLTLGSLVAAGLPLVTALVGVGVGVGTAFALSTSVEMNNATPVLALMIGLAVGIDYALFVVNRQRRLIIDQGLEAREAAGRAVGTAGSAVFFAGLTVMVALVALTVIGISMLTTMALVAAATVLLAVLIALTLLPAMLGLIGERIVSAKARQKGHTRRGDDASHSVADHWVKAIVRLRWPVIVGVVAVLGVGAVPAASMDLGLPSGATANTDTAARQSYELVTRGFGEGFNGPLLVTVESADGAAVDPQTLGAVTQQLQQHEEIVASVPVGTSQDGQIAVLSVIPSSGPNDDATADLVEALREPSSPVAQEHDVVVGVTGFTAIGIDMSDRLAEIVPLYLAIIVALSLLILLVVFRSLVVPIQATLGFLLSILATFGVTTAVFSWGWLGWLVGIDTGGPLFSFVPVIVTGILYGLAMDYQVFLVSSMRESYVHGYHGKASVVHGFDQASRVVVAAAVIMVSVFAGFIFSHDVMIKQIGFALAAGILIDAFLVRITLTPALMAIFGDKAWWLPRWLDRILPDLDVEGDRLLQMLARREDALQTSRPDAVGTQ
ncbi:MMPL family transporter [Nocardioides caldifontis]|uniref:MMPL family transporter n=1 Tax=Nocardioides caldifontis TaxID=2588938 RepID=UPI0011E032D0|nr:MMPL family transporter [Nocardioides caldifontis]